MHSPISAPILANHHLVAAHISLFSEYSSLHRHGTQRTNRIANLLHLSALPLNPITEEVRSSYQ